NWQPPPAWWEERKDRPDEQAVLWRVLPRGAPPPPVLTGAKAKEAGKGGGQGVGEIEGGGVRLSAPPRGTPPGAAVWAVAPLGPAASVAPAAPVTGPGLTTPDGQWFGPSTWLLLPNVQLSDRPLLQVLDGPAAYAARDEAHKFAGDWPDWVRFN